MPEQGLIHANREKFYLNGTMKRYTYTHTHIYVIGFNDLEQHLYNS